MLSGGICGGVIAAADALCSSNPELASACWSDVEGPLVLELARSLELDKKRGLRQVGHE